jgi:biotin synthase
VVPEQIMPHVPVELARAASGEPRNDWKRSEVERLFRAPFSDLVFTAQSVHRRHFDANQVQMAELLSIKTGGCVEDCAYCSQSAHFDTGLKAGRLMNPKAVEAAAKRARANGATRFCMGAAWREPKDRDMPALLEMVSGVKGLGLETCMTLGMLTDSQAQAFSAAGLDYYNHNIDTSPEFYGEIITTRTFDDRLATLERVRAAGIGVCCGGIIGMGESEADRVGMLLVLATLPEHPGSVPINALMPSDGTPLEGAAPIDAIDFVRTIAVARILMPKAVVRLSAGRENMSDEMQALCLLAGANSVFVGDRLLTAKNPGVSHDAALFSRLGVKPMPADD